MNKHDVSVYIKNQFPTAYEEGGENFVAFVEAYYEFMDANYFQNKTILETIDIDNTLTEFVLHFKETYLKDFPYVAATSKEFMIKNILDFYKSKGSILSTQLLIRMLFGDETKVFLPSLDILKPSDSKWVEPEYIEVSRSDRTIEFLNTEITGSKSRAKAIVEGIVTKRIEGKYIDVVYLSDVRGRFVKNEFVTNNGSLKNAPQTIGSLTTVTVGNGGRNNKIGDIFEVIGAEGSRGKVRVSEVIGATGRVDFSIEDGGFGFTATPDTDVYISDAVVMLKNPDLVYRKFDNIKQDMETLNLVSYGNISSNVKIGNYMTGINPNGTVVANGVVAQITDNGDGSGDVKLIIQSGTFGDQKIISVSGGNTAPFRVGDKVEEDSLVTLEVSSSTLPLAIGQKIEQANEINMSAKTGTLKVVSGANNFLPDEVITYMDAAGDVVIQAAVVRIVDSTTIKVRSIYTYKAPRTFVSGASILGTTSTSTAVVSSFTANPISSIYTDKISGVITSVSGNTVTLNKVWGEFISAKPASIYANETATRPTGGLLVNSVNYSERGAKGAISRVFTSSLLVQDIKGVFNASRVLKNLDTKATRNITGVANEGATDVRLNGVATANAAISLVSNTSASGIIIGQNTSAVGVWGNTNPFLSSGDISIPNTRRTIDSLSTNVSNDVTIVTKTAHGYVVGDNININIELQQADEVKRIYGVYAVVSVPGTQSFVVKMEPDYGDIIRQGGYNFFSATTDKTLMINAVTTRNDGPNIVMNVYGLASGFDANFKIGTLEGEETVFVNTDIIGGNNVVDIPYTNIEVSGEESGIGYVGAVKVDVPGTQYANGVVLTFTGGGYGGGNPEIVASAYITTSNSGSIVDVNVTDPGQGYYSPPTITLPATTGTTAVLTPMMEFGYGFPKMPEGGIENYLEDLWTSKEMTIGAISSLSEINPGSNYNANPFVLVYNSYIARFQRTDRIVVSTDGSSGAYMVGEILHQSIPGDGGSINTPKGYVSAVEGNTIYVKRMSFNTSFTVGYPLVGQTSGVSRFVRSIDELSGGMVLGDNAVIPAVAIAANGIATKLEVIDSGFGYVHNQPVTLLDPNKPFVITGTTGVTNHGKSEGSWDSTVSHLDGNSKMHDNDYYQEFSYEVITGKSINKYKNILSNIIHVAGTKMFGKVERRNFIDVSVKSRNSVVGNWSNFENAYRRLLPILFSSGENGDVLWPSVNNWYTDLDGVKPITAPGQPVACWRGSNKITNAVKKNLITWSDDFSKEGWSLVGATYNPSNSRVTLTTANSEHYLKKSLRVYNSGPYVLSAYITGSNHGNLTVSMEGSINGGYVTFNLINNTVFARSGGYNGKIIVNNDGTKRIVVYNRNERATDDNGSSIDVFFIFNSGTNHGHQTYVVNTANYITLEKVQLEVSAEETPYQDVTHGDEWDGMRYVQGKGKGFYPISSKMPVNGIKNVLEGSDDLRDSQWFKRNANVAIGPQINGESAFILKDTYNKNTQKEHSLSFKLPHDKPIDNFGFVVKATPTCRYVAIQFNDVYAIFDLVMGTCIDRNDTSMFSNYTAHRLEDGTIVIGVYMSKNNVKSFIKDERHYVKLVMMNGPDALQNMKYAGNGNSSLSILRGYCGYTGFDADYQIGLQKNRNRYDISQKGMESVWYITRDRMDQRLVGRVFGIEPTHVAIAGTNGIWFDTIEDDDFIKTHPKSDEIYRTIGGLIGMVILDRPFTNNEKITLEEYFKNGGSGDLIVEDEVEVGLDNFVNLTTSSGSFDKNTGMIELLTDGRETLIGNNVDADSLYKIEFDYTIDNSVTTFDLVDFDVQQPYASTIFKRMPMNVRQGSVSVFRKFDNMHFTINVKGYVGGRVTISNMTLTKYIDE